MDNQEQLAEELFEVALDMPPEKRAAYLDQACHDAPELRRIVEGLLLENDRAGSFMAEPLRHATGWLEAVCRRLLRQAASFPPGRWSAATPSSPLSARGEWA